MVRQNNRRAQPGGGLEGWAPLIVSGLVVLVIGVVNAGVRLDAWQHGRPVPGDPFEVLFDVARGHTPWPASGWVLVGVLVVVVVAVVVAVDRRHANRTRVDAAAAHMGAGRDIEPLTRANAAATAARLGAQVATPGTFLGNAVHRGTPLYCSNEDLQVDIWGTRRGKTTARAVPAILEALDRPTLVTSNKRDVVDATRGPCVQAGPVWVFDPQQIVGEEPTWWWDPLSYVVDEVKAIELAGHFAAASREQAARTDAFFDTAGKNVLAAYLLAAARAGLPITKVYSWLTRPSNREATDILAGAGFDLHADYINGVLTGPDRQRAGVLGTAQEMVAFLTNQQLARWITPGAHAGRRQFSPAQFVRAPGTLYSLSKEGAGSATPVVTALTVAVAEAAEAFAVQSPGGRLTVPCRMVLDEAANVCRWAQLPNLYSHYGSRGIEILTILQSWAQGVGVWGEDGMEKLWNAANVRVYGGGVDDPKFLERLSKVIGDFDRLASSTTSGPGNRSVSRHLQRERIMEVADLAALPRGRAVVFASGARPTLLAPVPWMASKNADAVRASIRQYDPKGTVTITALEADLAATTDPAAGPPAGPRRAVGPSRAR